MKTTLRSALFLLLATSALTLPTRAEDVPPVVTAIFKNWETQLKVTPTYDKIETGADGSVTITNLVANAVTQGAVDGAKVTIGEVSLKTVAVEKDGLINVGAATFKDTKIEFTGTDGKVALIALPEAKAEDWYIGVAGDNPTPAQAFRSGMGIAKKITSGKITFTGNGQTISTDGYQSSWDGDPATGAGKITMSLADVVIPEAVLSTIDPSGQMKALGYNELAFSASGDGEMTVTGDKFGMSANIGFVGKDVAGLKVSYAADGIPMTVMAEMQAAQKAGRPPEFAALMPQLMNVSLSNFVIRFEDASITKKVLPLIAKMQGMDEATLVSNAGAIMQLGLMQLKSQAFTDQVVGAVNAYLKDPKSITISMKPAQPVPVQSLMTLNPADPAAAITMLGVSVTAND